MPSEATAPGRRRRVLLATAVSIGVLVVAFAGWMRWRAITTECREVCAPDRAAGVLRLQTGVRLPLLRKDLRAGQLWVGYLTQTDMFDRSSICAEARQAMHALQIGRELADAVEVALEPTGGRLKVLGWTWTGPVVSCCQAVVIDFQRDATGEWRLSPGFCCAD